MLQYLMFLHFCLRSQRFDFYGPVALKVRMLKTKGAQVNHHYRLMILLLRFERCDHPSIAEGRLSSSFEAEAWHSIFRPAQPSVLC